MSHYDLTRADAAARSRSLTLQGAEVELDLTGAPDPAIATFPVRIRWDFTCAAASSFLDFIGDVHRLEINGTAVSEEALAKAVSPGRIELTGLRERNTVVVEGSGYYSRSGEGLHRYTDPEDGATYLYTQYEPTDARRVVPCFDQPDLRCPWTFTITAPRGWSVASNALPAPAGESAAAGAAAPRVPEDGQGLLHRFTATTPIPSYLTAVLAGPYHRVDSVWTSSTKGRNQTLPLTLWCRASMARHLPAEELFDLTRAGLDFYTDLFDLELPFGSYGQAFVPEYNLGAMENPGLVTLTEDYLFPDGPTAQQRAGRANTVLHEMAHMYFGDLVTIRWWEDLWLKESFAEFMGAYASAEATEFRSAWAGFAVRRKAWAYRQDALSTTHPIVADVPDVAAAKQNFDGITYAKGAAALKQLVAFVGIEAFVEACRLYFRRHAWGSAELADFLAVLEESSARDTRAWARDWLSTTNATEIDVVIEREATGIASPITRAALIPQGTAQDPSSARAHHLAVGLYSPASHDSASHDSASHSPASRRGDLERSRRIGVDIPAGHEPGRAIDLPGLVGSAGLVLVNDDDLDYAQYRLDPDGAAGLLEHLGDLPQPMARAVAWSHLWSMVRDARLDPDDYIGAVIHHIGRETESVIFETALERALEALEHYLPQRHRPERRRQLTDFVVTRLRAAAPGSDEQTALARTFGHLLARDGTYAQWAEALLRGTEALPGLRLGPALRWRLLTGLVASGHAGDSWIALESQRDASREAQIGRARTLASRPTQEAKEAAWEEILGAELSNDLLTATIMGFQLGEPSLLEPYRDRYFAVLAGQWATRSIGMATRVVTGLYPRACESAAQSEEADSEGADSEGAGDAVVRSTEAWLKHHGDAPGALRRLLAEQLDERRRLVRIQACARS
ncbi:aminopeptidase N [Kocuria coralli]|uniref:Aminopeptidase N n=1 Tax=Kocuria coralli TaxID=1461025 RepID=A0A5J5KWA7_9MICC|nr:aminopeptidase N [Kocuria coralli]KAA9393131.1 aminopeptidase N [Kocuria coralli]